MKPTADPAFGHCPDNSECGESELPLPCPECFIVTDAVQLILKFNTGPSMVGYLLTFRCKDIHSFSLSRSASLACWSTSNRPTRFLVPPNQLRLSTQSKTVFPIFILTID